MAAGSQPEKKVISCPKSHIQHRTCRKGLPPSLAPVTKTGQGSLFGADKERKCEFITLAWVDLPNLKPADSFENQA